MSKILGMAVTLPKETFDLNEFEFNKEAIRRTMELSGIHRVRIAPDDKTALDYCINSAERLIEELNFDKNSIDGIITANPHPDYLHPGNYNLVQSRLKLPKKCIAFDTSHPCTGMVYSLFLADTLIKSGYCNNILICVGDTSSRHINFRDRSLKMVIGDGGGAAIITRGESETVYSYINEGESFYNLYTPAGGERMPIKAGVTDVEETDEEGNVRRLEDEYMDGLEVMRFVLNEVPQLVEEVLTRKNWSKEEVNTFVFHQANAFMVNSLKKKLKIKAEQVLINVDDAGNIGGASVALAMCREAKGKSKEWKKAIIGGFGAGMSAMVMSTNLSETYFSEVKII